MTVRRCTNEVIQPWRLRWLEKSIVIKHDPVHTTQLIPHDYISRWLVQIIMTPCYGNTNCIAGPFTDHRWIRLARAGESGFLCYWQNTVLNKNCSADDMRHNDAKVTSLWWPYLYNGGGNQVIILIIRQRHGYIQLLQTEIDDKFDMDLSCNKYQRLY